MCIRDRDKTVFRYETLADLAKAYDIPLKALQQQVDEYNKIVAGTLDVYKRQLVTCPESPVTETLLTA